MKWSEERGIPSSAVPLSLILLWQVSKGQEEEEEEEALLEIKPVYHTIFCRESRVWHDTGIVWWVALKMY